MFTIKMQRLEYFPVQSVDLIYLSLVVKCLVLTPSTHKQHFVMISLSFSACPKNLPALAEVERVEQGGLGEENPLKCENEDDCWLKYRYLIDRSNQAAKRENGECDDVPENEKTICNLFLGVGKRELNSVVPSLKETPSRRRRGFANPLTRDLDLDPFCHYPFCRYSPPGKKKFMVKKAASKTDHEEKVNAVPSSDSNGMECPQNDFLCVQNGGLGRKRSVSGLIHSSDIG